MSIARQKKSFWPLTVNGMEFLKVKGYLYKYLRNETEKDVNYIAYYFLIEYKGKECPAFVISFPSEKMMEYAEQYMDQALGHMIKTEPE